VTKKNGKQQCWKYIRTPLIRTLVIWIGLALPVNIFLLSLYYICLWILYLWLRASQLYIIINNQHDTALSSLIYYSLRDYSQ